MATHDKSRVPDPAATARSLVHSVSERVPSSAKRMTVHCAPVWTQRISR